MFRALYMQRNEWMTGTLEFPVSKTDHRIPAQLAKNLDVRCTTKQVDLGNGRL